MKTPRPRGSFACLVVAVVLVLFAAGGVPLRAGGTGAVGGTATASGAAVGTGGHSAGAVSAGSAHVSAAAPVHGNNFSPVGASNGFHNGGNLRPMTATYSGPPRYLPGGFAPTIASHAPSMRAGGSRPALAANPARVAGLTRANTATARNAWTDPSQGDFSGTVLYPGTLPDNPASRFGAGNNYGAGSTGRYPRYHQYNRRYFPFYGYPYPYLFSGGYAPYFDGGLGLATSGAIGDADNHTAESYEPSAAANNDLSRPYPGETYAASPALNAPADTPDTASAPAPASRSVQENTGPDSLVEAVQAELSRRGYFGGKVDAIYNGATHAAIQRFQNDQQLPATGRINEATLHALQLD